MLQNIKIEQFGEFVENEEKKEKKERILNKKRFVGKKQSIQLVNKSVLERIYL